MRSLIKRPAELYEDSGSDIAVPILTKIPTTDSEAALKFCQQLNKILARNPDTAKDYLDASRNLSDDKQLLSVVIPIYNEEHSLPELYSRLTAVLSEQQMEYEIIFVDDASTDQSHNILDHYASENPRIVIVQLTRNFGHQTAITAGLDHTQGEAVIVMDGDLQDPPEALSQLVSKWRQGYEVVYAIRERRKEHWLKCSAYAAFYRLLRRVANIEIPLDSGDFCIMDRRVVNLLSSMPERNRFVRGIRSWVGFNQIGVPVERHARIAGKPKYTFTRLILLALDGLVSFSYLPLRIITLAGFAISAISILLAFFYAFKRLLTGLGPPGFATLVVALFFLAGIQLITMGVIGEYVGRIFEEVKQRPLYLVRKITRKQSSCVC